MVEGRKPEHPEKSSDEGELQKMPHTKAYKKFKIKPQPRLKPALAFGAFQESRRANHYIARRPRLSLGCLTSEQNSTCISGVDLPRQCTCCHRHLCLSPLTAFLA